MRFHNYVSLLNGDFTVNLRRAVFGFLFLCIALCVGCTPIKYGATLTTLETCNEVKNCVNTQEQPEYEGFQYTDKPQKAFADLMKQIEMIEGLDIEIIRDGYIKTLYHPIPYNLVAEFLLVPAQNKIEIRVTNQGKIPLFTSSKKGYELVTQKILAQPSTLSLKAPNS